jgi:hypothetical protein
MRVPARYTGSNTVKLAQVGGPYVNGEGRRLDQLTLSPGDVLMLPAEEVYGQTHIFDPRQQDEPEWLGVGRVVKPQHSHLPSEVLGALGYVFDEGRSDFEAVWSVTEARAKMRAAHEGSATLTSARLEVPVEETDQPTDQSTDQPPSQPPESTPPSPSKPSPRSRPGGA